MDVEREGERVDVDCLGECGNKRTKKEEKGSRCCFVDVFRLWVLSNVSEIRKGMTNERRKERDRSELTGAVKESERERDRDNE